MVRFFGNSTISGFSGNFPGKFRYHLFSFWNFRKSCLNGKRHGSSLLFSFHVLTDIPERYKHEKPYRYNGSESASLTINFFSDVQKGKRKQRKTKEMPANVIHLFMNLSLNVREKEKTAPICGRLAAAAVDRPLFFRLQSESVEI